MIEATLLIALPLPESGDERKAAFFLMQALRDTMAHVVGQHISDLVLHMRNVAPEPLDAWEPAFEMVVRGDVLTLDPKALAERARAIEAGVAQAKQQAAAEEASGEDASDFALVGVPLDGSTTIN